MVITKENVILQERLRLQTLARYFAPVHITADIVKSPHDRPLSPTLSESTQLTAITQNGALKLQCDRAFVSLVDATTQYIIAEATRTISLYDAARYSTPQDALFLGVQALDKSYGICPNSIAIFTDTKGDMAIDSHGVVANSSRYVIRDLRTLEQYKDRPYVVGFPYMRSYVEVPIKSPDGQVLGTYCAMDTVVRDDFFDDTVCTLTEIAGCITEYLELQTIKQTHARGERLLEGLSKFTDGRSRSEKEEVARSSVRTASTASDTSIRTGGRVTTDEYFSELFSPNRSPSDTISPSVLQSDLSSETSPIFCSNDTSSVKTPSDFSGLSCSSCGSSVDHETKRDLQADNADGSESDNVFSRAADLIRGAIDLEGLTFLDASTRSANASSTLICDILGSSLASEGCALDPQNVPLLLREDSLGYLATNYPHGCLLSADEYGSLLPNGKRFSATQSTLQELSSQPQDVPLEIQNLLVKARSLMFLPLWDYSRERFFAGILGWSTDPTRVFQKQDITCLSAFGNALTNEVARSEAVDIARTKSDFLSSVSHELRSPLHGILASVEILEDMVMEDSQSDLINMIHNCGSTLLDALNHLLDFSKINGMTDTKGHVRKLSKSSPNSCKNAFGKCSVEYLCRLVLEVVEGVHFGQTSQKTAIRQKQSSPGKRNGRPTDPAIIIDSAHDIGSYVPPQSADVVGVFVNVENRADWCMSLSTGAWKRIIMNLFANALKYTHRGHIEVSLKMANEPQHKDSGVQFAHLTVSDTGIGMSEDYIKYHLYKPFVQENPLANGTGLGLSIVKQIVGDLDGTISVESTPGTGTRFDVLIPLGEKTLDFVEPPLSGGQMVDPSGVLKGLSLCIVSPSFAVAMTLESNLERQRTETMQTCITSAVDDWYDMKVVSAQSLDEVEADFFLVQAPYTDSINHPIGELSRKYGGLRIIIVDPSPLFHDGDFSLYDNDNITRLTYPISPKSLGKALLTALGNASNSSAQEEDCKRPLESKVQPSITSKHARSGSITLDHANIRFAELALPDDLTKRKQRHLLLVDDNAINLKLLSTYVSKLGYTADTAENGYEAYKLYRETTTPFSAILMDISMPIMDGFQASRAIREYETRNPEKVPQPARIVALTGLGSEGSKQEAALSGIDEFRIKPIGLKILKELLDA